ncbi:MAG: MFS transporter [Oscillospiraceae bacterium]|nr:MFS transporter [Oscillospiraceae bacterium]
MKRKAALWSKDFLLACLIGLFFSMCQRILDSNLASFADYTWNSKTLGGYLTSAFCIGSIVMAFFSGRLVDTKGRRNCLFAGAFLFCISTLAMAINTNPVLGLISRFLQGAFKSVLIVAVSAIVSDVVPKNRMNEGMGYYNIGSTISMAIGPMIGLTLAELSGYGLMFSVSATCLFLSSALSIGINYEKKANRNGMPTPKQPKEIAETYSGIWKLLEKKVIMYSVNNTVYFAGYSCILVFVTIYAQECLLLNSSEIGLFYTAAAIAMLPVRIFGSKIGDIRGVLFLIIPGHVCIILVLLILAFFAKGNYPLFLAAGVMYGLGTAAVMPAMNAASVVDAPAGRAGTANATFFFLLDFGVLFASAFFGRLIDSADNAASGYTQMFIISIIISVLSLMMSLVLFNNKARERRRAR